jgi:hypothetical protein
MSMTKQSIDLLVDMLENRLSDMVVTDREDAKEQFSMRRALQELSALGLAQDKSAKRRATRTTTRLRPELLAMSSAQFGY